MSKNLDLSAVEPMSELCMPLVRTTLPPTLEPLEEVDATSDATTYEGSTNSHPLLWEPNTPQFTKAIAEYYGVSRKTVQEWFQKVKSCCPWFAEGDLRLADGRYTVLCMTLMGDYRISGLPVEAWKARVWEQNPELVAEYEAAQSPSPLPDSSSGAMTPYERSEGLMNLLGQRQLPQYGYTCPDENPTILLLRQRLMQRTGQNADIRSRLEQFTKATTDTQLAYETLEELEAIQEGEETADRLFFLREQAKQRRLEELKLEMLGKSPVPDTPIAG